MSFIEKSSETHHNQMEPETHQNPPSFSMKTPFSQDGYKTKHTMFQNNKWKTLSIHQGEKELLKLHGDCLEDEDFKENVLKARVLDPQSNPDW